MGRRVRHLNPVHAGANVALDARFISGLADNATVQTWSSRPGGSRNYTQSTNARRPIYRTNIQNGQPVVRFTEASQRWMSNTSIPIASTTAQSSILIAIRGGATIVYSQTSNASFLGADHTQNFTIRWQVQPMGWVTTASISYDVGSAIGAPNPIVLAAGRSGTAQIFWMPARGATQFTTTGSTANLSTTRNSTTPDRYGTADICALSIIPVANTEAMTRRILDSYSYSFKIQSP